MTAVADPMALYAMLCCAADAGQECPTNRQICERFGLRSSSGAVRLMRALEQQNLISVRRFQMSRIVTIMKTKRSTAEPALKTKHWREREKTDAEAVREMVKAASALPEPKARLRPDTTQATRLQARLLNKGTNRPLAIQPGFSGSALPGGCRFIESHDYLDVIAAGGSPFCGKPVSEVGGSWCQHHRAIVFTKKPDPEAFAAD